MENDPNQSNWWSLLKEAIQGKNYDYTQGSLKKAIILLAIPMVFEMVMHGGPWV